MTHARPSPSLPGLKPASWLIALAAGLLMLAAAPASAREPGDAATTEPGAKFLRFTEDDDGHARLEAAIATYQRGPTRVDLVSAVHVAEASFYEGLNRAFAEYDLVLYEMVKPRDMKPLKPQQMAEGNRGGISAMHRLMQRATQLAFQMDLVDYTPDHFVHADLDWETFADAFEQQNEMTGILLRSYASAAAGEQTSTVRPEVLMGQFLLAASDPKHARTLKYMLAQEFAHVEKMTAALAGPDGGVILGRRNRAAIEALQGVITTRPQRIALFYGAAHMQDLGERLEAMGFKPVETRWLTAWDIPAAPETPATQPAAP